VVCQVGSVRSGLVVEVVVEVEVEVVGRSVKSVGRLLTAPDRTMSYVARGAAQRRRTEEPESPSVARGAAQRRRQSASLKVEGGSKSTLLRKEVKV
jgi:hypothetical protein